MMCMFDEFKTCLTNHMHVMDILIDIRIKIELIVVNLDVESPLMVDFDKKVNYMKICVSFVQIDHINKSRMFRS